MPVSSTTENAVRPLSSFPHVPFRALFRPSSSAALADPFSTSLLAGGSNEIASTGTALDAEQCTLVCADDDKFTCGGENAIDIYTTTKTVTPTFSASSTAETSTSTSTSTAPTTVATPAKVASSDWSCSSRFLLLFYLLAYTDSLSLSSLADSGCWTDSVSARTLATGFASNSWTASHCLDLVAAAGLRYGGIIYGGECCSSSFSLSSPSSLY
jgi:hypothetical protein